MLEWLRQLPSTVRLVALIVLMYIGLVLLDHGGAFKSPAVVIGCILVLTAFAGFLFLSGVRSAPTITQPSHKRIQLIAWSGFSEPEVVRPYEVSAETRLDVLEYVRGVEKVTHLRHEGSLFDVLISDVEFLTRHHIGFKLQSLLNSPEYAPLWDKVVPSLASAVKQVGKGLGIPVRFGLNDVVVNVKAAPQPIREMIERNDPDISYTHFKLQNLVKHANPGCRIGLWNWYLPTLTQLLLTDGVSIDEVALQGRDRIQKLTDYISHNDAYFVLCDEPDIATQYLIDRKVWIILGVGGAFLPPVAHGRDELRAIFPKEGGVLFVECAAVIRNPRGSEALSRGYLEHLLNVDTQLLLSHRQSYRTSPVTKEALAHVSEQDYERLNLHRVFNNRDDFTLAPNVVLRKLPTAFWREWENCWEVVDNKITHAK